MSSLCLHQVKISLRHSSIASSSTSGICMDSQNIMESKITNACLFLVLSQLNLILFQPDKIKWVERFLELRIQNVLDYPHPCCRINISLERFFSFLLACCHSCGAGSFKRTPCAIKRGAGGEKTSAERWAQPAAAAAATWDQPQHLPGDDRALRGEHDRAGRCRLRSECCAGERFHLHSPQPSPH